MGWLMGLEPTTTGITIARNEDTSAIQSTQQQCNHRVGCSTVFSLAAVFCRSVSRQCPTRNHCPAPLPTEQAHHRIEQRGHTSGRDPLDPSNIGAYQG